MSLEKFLERLLKWNCNENISLSNSYIQFLSFLSYNLENYPAHNYQL